jgi:hypothetical protein
MIKTTRANSRILNSVRADRRWRIARSDRDAASIVKPVISEPTPTGDRGSLASRILLGALVVAAPMLVTSALLAVLFDATLLDYFPLASDEVAYYQQIATFVRAGFNGGYFTNYEMPAPLAVTHFSVHGPAFPVIYGAAGRLLGWTLQSGPLFNLAALAIATTFFITLARLSCAQIIDTGFVMLTSWWVLFMAPTTMQETLNQAMLVAVAAFAAPLFNADAHRRGRLLMCALALLGVASVLRPSNWIVAIPLVLVGFAPRGPRAALLAALLASLCIPVFWLTWRYMSAPVPDAQLELGRPTSAGIVSRIIQYGLYRTSTNLSAIFDLRAFVSQPFSLHVMFEGAALVAIFGLAVGAVLARSVRAGQGIGPLLDRTAFKVDLFVLGVVGASFAALMGFYFGAESSHSRVMAPFLLMSLLVLVATQQRMPVVVMVVVANVLIAPSFLSAYRDERTALFTYDRQPHERFRNQIASFLTFDPGGEPWCNTLLTMVYPREIVAVPAGIGLSIGEPPSAVAAPVRSAYLLLTEEGAKVYRSKANVRRLTATEFGELYLNLDARCRSLQNPDP